jgi:hypothetical protein
VHIGFGEAVARPFIDIAQGRYFLLTIVGIDKGLTVGPSLRKAPQSVVDKIRSDAVQSTISLSLQLRSTPPGQLMSHAPG